MNSFLTSSGAFVFATVTILIFVFPLFAVLLAIGYFLIKSINEDKKKYKSNGSSRVDFKRTR